MTDIQKDGSQAKYAPTVVERDPELYPNIQYFLKKLLKDINIEIKHHTSFRYHVFNRNQIIFMRYFIQKCLSNQYNVEITDVCTEKILQNPDNYIVGENKKLRDSIREHYDIFKDSKTQAMDIIRSIKIVSLSLLIYEHNPIPKEEYNIIIDHLREIKKYFEQLTYKSLYLNSKLSCDYFKSNTNIIFDNEVIYDIITLNEPNISLSDFHSIIIQSFIFYKMTDIKIEKFKIYNPLFGDEFSIVLKNMDYKLFEKVIKFDTELRSQWDEISGQQVLDLSLFPIKNNDK